MFYDREQDCSDIWKLIKEGKNLLMLAPRRVGKTRLLHRLREQTEAHGCRAIVFEMAGYRDEKAFLQRLCEAIQDELSMGKKVLTALTQRLGHALKGHGADDWRQLLLQTDWPEFAENLLRILDEDNEKNWLIMVDEIAIFVRDLLLTGDRQRAVTFLYWLRNMQQKYRHVRWIYSGSIGLDAVARREDIEGALVDMEIYPLKPFTPPTAAGYVKALADADGCRVDEEALALLLGKLGWLAPYYLEKIAKMAFRFKDEAGLVTPAAVENAINEMLNLTHRTYWSTWREHLTLNFTDPERTHLFTVLAVISRDSKAVSRDTLLTHMNQEGTEISAKTLAILLDILEADGYLTPEDDSRRTFRFLMPLLGVWWLRHVVQGGC